jgi:hypothetical protein
MSDPLIAYIIILEWSDSQEYAMFYLSKTTFDQSIHLKMTLEESLSITTGRCDLAIATHARKMHKKISI